MPPITPDAPDHDHDGTIDNLDAAIADYIERDDLTIPTNTGSTPGSPATKQVICRTNPGDHERWKAAAERMGMTLNEFIRDCCNSKSTELLDCNHPLNQRRYYPWAEFCLKCGHRLRG